MSSSFKFKRLGACLCLLSWAMYAASSPLCATHKYCLSIWSIRSDIIMYLSKYPQARFSCVIQHRASLIKSPVSLWFDLIFFSPLDFSSEQKWIVSTTHTHWFEPGKAYATPCNVHRNLIRVQKPRGLSQWQFLAANCVNVWTPT